MNMDRDDVHLDRQLNTYLLQASSGLSRATARWPPVLCEPKSSQAEPGPTNNSVNQLGNYHEVINSLPLRYC
jgi:hypothetical protein